ncbi:MAG: glycosyl transferase [Gammaproteobacteria bacterium]|nr:MAG: glycosyl transferase [Gammaproteobacteria bacterium]
MVVTVFFAILAFAIAFFGTFLLRRYALSVGLMDKPNRRSSHTVAMPRGGGIAVVASFSICLSLADLFGLIDSFWLFAALMPAWAVAIVGLIDDLGHVSARYRLVIHFSAAAWALSFLVSGHSGFSSAPVAVVLLVSGIVCVSIVWLLNLFNFMDGIDGIVVVEALSVTVCSLILIAINGGLDVVGFPMSLFLMAMMGFGCWNFPKAKIFMGDVGSGFVGFAMAIFILVTVLNDLLSVFIWLILLAFFWVDATYTLLRRLFTGQNVAEAHRSHAYQILALRWRAHWKVSCTVAAINLFWLFPLACLANTFVHAEAVSLKLAVLVIAVSPLFFFQVRLRAGEKPC